MRMLIAGGGTGGHLFPGLALAEEVKTRHPRNDVLFVGTQRGLEMRVVPKSGFPLETIDVGPLKRQGGLGLLRGLGRVPRSLWQSRRILRRFDPDVVVGVGGYASGPVVLAAYLMGIPTAVQEQNALADSPTVRWVDSRRPSSSPSTRRGPVSHARARTCSGTPSAAPFSTTTCTPRCPATGSRSWSPEARKAPMP